MGEEWTIEALPADAGVDLRIVLPADGEPVTVVSSPDRAQARAFGRSVLAAAGDAWTGPFRRQFSRRLWGRTHEHPAGEP
jgi:hypothetical protein